jgi:hypothetical protein
LVFWLTVTIGTDGVNVGVIVGVSVGKGVLTGVSVAGGVLAVKASSVPVTAASASSSGFGGVWEGRLQADIPRIRMQPATRIFLIMIMWLSRIR